MPKKIKKISDPMAEVRKHKDFLNFSKEARVNVRLAVMVYQKRKEKGWTQTELAKRMSSTQRIISNIESGDISIGTGLLKRVAEALSFTSNDFADIFETPFYYQVIPNIKNTITKSIQTSIEEPAYSYLKSYDRFL